MTYDSLKSTHTFGLYLQHATKEQICHGRFNLFVLGTCGLILLYATTECLAVGYLLDHAACDLQFSVSQRGLIASSTFMGVVLTAIPWGYLADARGRRCVMLPALFVAVLASLGSSLAINFGSMFTLRMLTGALISASIATVYAYLGELVLESKRAQFVSWTSAFIAISFVTMPAMAWGILPRHAWSFVATEKLSIVPWRVFVWAGCLWGLMATIGLLILPESPRYLLVAKGPGAARTVMAKMYAWNYNRNKADFPVADVAASAEHRRPTMRESARTLINILRPPLRRCVIISHICIFLLFMQTNAFYVWMPSIINELLNSNDTRVTMCHVMETKYKQQEAKYLQRDCSAVKIDSRMYPISMAMGVLTAVTYLGIGYSVDFCGKKKVYFLLVMVCSAMTLASGLVPHVYGAMALLVPGLCGGAGTSVLVTLIIEVFPTSLRAIALCTLFMVARLGAALGSNVLGHGLQNNCVAATIAFTSLTAASTFLLCLWPDGARLRAEMEAKNFVY